MKLMKLIPILLIILVTVAYAEEPEALKESQAVSLDDLDLSGFSSDELLSLRQLIDIELDKRGYSLRTDLDRGDKGNAVIELQLRLDELGFFEGSINGKYDTNTQKAMKRFEKANGLSSDGRASREDQILLFSENAIPEKGQENGAIESEEEEFSSENINSEYAEYESLDYVAVMRNPEEYRGSKVFVFGRVLQIIGSRNVNLALRVGSSGYNDAVYVTVSFDPGYNYIEGDLIKIYGIVSGTKTYSAVLGNSITIPEIKATEIELKK